MVNPKIVELNKSNFDKTIANGEPVLVEFWATWSGPSRMVRPVIDALADEHEGVTIGKVDIDNQQEIAIQFGIQNVPTFLLFIGGEVKDRMVGAMTKSAFDEFLKDI